MRQLNKSIINLPSLLKDMNNLKLCIIEQRRIHIEDNRTRWRHERAKRLWNEFDGMWKIVIVKRGDIFYADLSPVIGSEQGGVRPVIVIQNDIGNKYSPTIIIAAITSQINKAKLPTHIEINAPDYGLPKDSVVLLEQIRTIDKRRLREKIGNFDDDMMDNVDECLKISIGLDDA